ncbi:DHA2 family efflux MFS transporter permease subunit [Conexibacter stalactiti]|uniref:DHA2 family efflux MFS transporter permease subunit n=1 Tax=Conexibacter stalactiti TaxID=1940611 RepID=A0ABU4HXL0_9ACTN|nr:DHA2 family efflux MFS transporter permease subunit [Conexibacter stalactiti]MDW5597599.1 DHA2 family efflux MFS transporter permease subunit [Conexibacter stalactiti]MEC5038241.1 DHA2 family efflux MFS transporter permease subunit [Conexibacter stalactiti]
MPPAERPGRVLALVSVAVFMASLDLFIVNVAMPELARDFAGSSLAELSWVLNAYAIVFAALLIPAGRIADRIGRRRAFSGGIALFTLASALCGLAPSVELLVAARVVQAVGAAFLMPTSLALLLPAFAPEKRPVAIGVWAAVGGVAAAAGPPLGGLLTELSWRLVFLVNVPVGIVAVLLAGRVLREARDPSAQRPDLLGTALLVAGVALLSLGLVQAPEWGWGDSRTVAALAVAALALAGFAAHCARSASPVIEPSLLRVRSFALANLSVLLFMTAFAATLLANVLFLTDVWGWSVLHAGVALTPGPLFAAATAVPGGRLAVRYGQRTIAALGCALFAVSAAWAAWRMEAEPVYWSVLLPAWCVGGVGVGFTLAPLSSAAAASLPPARFATGTAVFTTSRQLGAVLGVAILVALLGDPAAGGDPLGAFQEGWWFIAAAAAAAAVVASAIGPVRLAAAPAAPASAPAPAA